MTQKRTDKIVFLIFLLIAVLGGVAANGFLGFGWDEPAQRTIGQINFDFYFNGSTEVYRFFNRDYGPILEVILIGLEKLFGLTELEDIYTFRHSVCTGIFLMGGFVFYKTLQLLKVNSLWALVGGLLIVAHPRLVGQSMFNSKDIPFLVCYGLAILYSFQYLIKPTVRIKVVLGIVVGVLVSLRVVGLIIPMLLSLYALWEFWKSKKIRVISNWLGLGVISFLSMILFWPSLWENPFKQFVLSIFSALKFRWPGSVLYFGEYIKADSLPVSYLPVWFLVTTPILLLVIALLSVLSLRKLPFRKDFSIAEKQRLFLFGSALVPLAMAFVTRPVIYDDWRHFYFVFPPLFLGGFLFIYQWIQERNVALKHQYIFLASLVLVSVIETVVSLPYPHLYFSKVTQKLVVEHDLREEFEMDYWGTSVYQSLHYISSQAAPSSDTVYVYGETETIGLNIDIWNGSNKETTLVYEFIDDSDFFVSHYRWHPSVEFKPQYGKLEHSIDHQGVILCGVYNQRITAN